MGGTHRGDASVIPRIHLPAEQRAHEEVKKREVLREIDDVDFGQVIVHKYCGQIMQVEVNNRRRFPKAMCTLSKKRRESE